MGLEFQGYLVIALTLTILVVMVKGVASLDAIGFGVIVILVAGRILPLSDALHGFANYAVITIGALYVIGEGLTRTGAVEFLAQWVMDQSHGKERRMIVLMALIAAFSSAFINNTAVVVVFIPVLLGVARTTGIPASRLLMPLSFASLLGGMCTLVGTSTNLLVSGVAEELGAGRIGMFEMSPVGLPMTLVCIAFMALFTRRLLPVRQSLSAAMAEADHREYVTELVIGPTSPLVGKTYADAFGDLRTRLMFFVRDEEITWPPFDDAKVRPRDAVMLRGSVDELADTQSKLGLKLVGDVKFDPHTMVFFELAVSPRSSITGMQVGNLKLFRDFGSIPVAVLRSGQHLHERVSNLRLAPGDVILACGEESALPKLSASTDFFLLTGAHHRVKLRSHAKRALWIAAGVVTLFSFHTLFAKRPAVEGGLAEVSRWAKALEMPVVALAGAIAMVASRCVTARRAYRCVDWPVLFFIVGMLALGKAMEQTHAAAFFAKGIVGSLADLGPAMVASGLVLICIVLNALVSHSAVAVLMTPIAIGAARQVAALQGLAEGDPYADAIRQAFILAIAFGGSICFFTPIGHQTNLMVYGPGGYRYSDFLRLGLPISLIAWIIVSLGLPVMCGL